MINKRKMKIVRLGGILLLGMVGAITARRLCGGIARKQHLEDSNQKEEANESI